MNARHCLNQEFLVHLFAHRGLLPELRIKEGLRGPDVAWRYCWILFRKILGLDPVLRILLKIEYADENGRFPPAAN